MKTKCERCIHYKKTWENVINLRYLEPDGENKWTYNKHKNYKMCMVPDCFTGKSNKKITLIRVASQITLNSEGLCLYYTPGFFWKIIEKILYFFKKV